MQAFADLYTALDETTSTNDKVAAMAAYFAAAPPEDAVWAVYFLSGRRPKRLVRSSDLREWAADAADLPRWLFDESYSVVGDLAETIALLLPEGKEGSERSLQYWVERRLLPLRRLDPDAQREAMLIAWSELNHAQRFVWNKLITSGFRVGVSKKLLVRALEQTSGIDAAVLTHRLMGNWEPSADFYERLMREDTSDADKSRPYPFCLAHPVNASPEEDDPDLSTQAQIAGSLQEQLGDVGAWQVEWKWDGIRAQIVRRGGRVYIWSRGEELITDTFPEVRDSAMVLPDGVVLDGELVAWRDGGVLPFGQLQRRIGRKSVSKRMLREVPICFLAFDVLERDGRDVRELPLSERLEHLNDVLEHGTSALQITQAPTVQSESWKDLAALHTESRDRLVEGFMLKRLDASYAVGRKTGTWWKWKVDPFSVDAVLLYAQRGHGKRATLYTDYTFAVWMGEDLVPFAKAYSGLTDAEIREVDRFVRENTIDRFGPVRAVEPELVFEIGFEGIRKSSRHKSGIAVRFPRMLRRRTDKDPSDADSIDVLRALLPDVESG